MIPPTYVLITCLHDTTYLLIICLHDTTYLLTVHDMCTVYSLVISALFTQASPDPPRGSPVHPRVDPPGHRPTVDDMGYYTLHHPTCANTLN